MSFRGEENNCHHTAITRNYSKSGIYFCNNCDVELTKLEIDKLPIKPKITLIICGIDIIEYVQLPSVLKEQL